jgi:hypothetical protein
MLLRASKACHAPLRYTSNQALKSMGDAAGGTPISPRYPVQYRAGMFKELQIARSKDDSIYWSDELQIWLQELKVAVARFYAEEGSPQEEIWCTLGNIYLI